VINPDISAFCASSGAAASRAMTSNRTRFPGGHGGRSVRRRSCEEISRPSMHVHGRGSEPKMASFLHLWLENAVRPACALGECYYSTLKTGRSGARCWSPHPLRWHCAAAEGLRAGETTNGTIQEDSDGDLHALSLPNEISRGRKPGIPTSRMAESIGRKVWFRRKQGFFRSRPGGQLSIRMTHRKSWSKAFLTDSPQKRDASPPAGSKTLTRKNEYRSHY